MTQYNIYIGLTSSEYRGTYECENLDEAIDYAYDLAREEYEDYAGLHGIPSWEELEEEVRTDYADEIESGEYDEAWIESLTEEYWNDAIESWISYSAVPTDTDDIDEEDIYLI